MAETTGKTTPVANYGGGGDRRGGQRGPGRGRDTGRRRPVLREQDEFDHRMVELSRVTRVMAGGKRMRFRACVVVGDRKGRVGWAAAKGSDVAMAMQKAITRAKKNVMNVSIVNESIPHEIVTKFKAARLLLKPAKKGKGLIAGGVVRIVLELAGIKNVISKMYGSNNKINNVAATFKALSGLRRVDPAPHDATEQKGPVRPKGARAHVSE